MNSTQRIAVLIVVIGAVSAAVITALVLYFYQPGRARHDAVLPPNTAVRLVMEPAQVQGYISSLAPGITKFVPGVPKVTSLQPRAFRTDWIHALPYELALLFSEPKGTSIDVTFFVNPLPDSSFLGEFNRFNALREIRGIAWNGTSTQEVTPEYATAAGTVRGDSVGNGNASVAALGIPEIDGGHWLEFSAVNAGDVLSQLHTAMDQAWNRPGTVESSEALTFALPGVRRMHITGNLTADDELTFTIRIDTVSPEARDAVDRAMGVVSETMAETFARRWNWTFGGGYGWQGNTSLEGEYTLRGFESRLSRALGGGR